MFEDFFGVMTGTRRRRGPIRGEDTEVSLKISLEDTLSDQEREVLLKTIIICPRCQGSRAEPGTKMRICPTCGGSGQVRRMIFDILSEVTTCPQCEGEGKIPEELCTRCHGEGRVNSEEKVKVLIRAGINTNQKIKLEGKGKPGRKGGKAGDLYIRVVVKPHPVFERKGDDLYTSLQISFSQAALGDEIEVQTLEGTKILLKVPAGTESGKILRVSGKGIPHFSGYGRGNLFIELRVKTPKKLTKKQKELLEKLKEEGV